MGKPLLNSTRRRIRVGGEVGELPQRPDRPKVKKDAGKKAETEAGRRKARKKEIMAHKVACPVCKTEQTVGKSGHVESDQEIMGSRSWIDYLICTQCGVHFSPPALTFPIPVDVEEY